MKTRMKKVKVKKRKKRRRRRRKRKRNLWIPNQPSLNVRPRLNFI